MNLLKIAALFLLLASLYACQSSESSNSIAALEERIATNPTAEDINQLMAKYQANLARTDIAATAKAETVGKLAQLQLKDNQVRVAIQTLKEGIEKYYDAPATVSNVWALGQIFQDIPIRQDVGKTIYKLYQKVFPSGANITMVNQELAQDSTTLSEHLDMLGSKMYDEKTHRLDTKVAGNFIESCELFALLQPKDPSSPDYLHKAGETARAIRSFPRAIGIYDKIYNEYPSFEKAPQALFLKAFTYDNDLKDFDKARTLYTEFLEKFPTDEFADDTRFLLKNLGKTDEEIIQSFGQEKEGE